MKTDSLDATVEGSAEQKFSLADAGEEWKAIPRWEGVYEISSEGRVRRVDGRHKWRGGYIKTSAHHSTGYPRCVLMMRGRREQHTVHSLVAEAFHGPRPDGGAWEVDHINCIRHDNRASNLRWLTKSQNAQRRKMPKGADNRNAKLSPEAVRAGIERWLNGESPAQIAKTNRVSKVTMARAINRTCWQHLRFKVELAA